MHRHRKRVYAFITQLTRDCILVTVQTIVKTDEI